MNIQKILLLACIFATAPMAVFAQDNAFAQLDTNNDGFLTMQEVEPIWSKELFDSVDENGDGKISVDEYALGAGQ